MEQDRNNAGSRAGTVGVILNIVLAAAKLLTGILSGAVAITADAVNNFSDAASSVISAIGFKLANKPADEEHPFGHARYEYISGLIISFLIMLAGYELLKTSVEKLIHPEETDYSVWLFLVLIASILVKLFMMFFYRRTNRTVKSTVLEAAAQDSRNDCAATGAVLLGAIISLIFDINLDGFMGLLVSLFILYSGIMLIKDTSAPLLGQSPDAELVERIEKRIMSYEGVLGTHDLMVHDYGPGHRFASVHVEVAAEDDVLDSHEMIDNIERDFQQAEGLHMVIHYDPIVTSEAAVGDIRSYLALRVKEIDPSITIHDLRIVPGEENTNVIFDCVVPHGVEIGEKKLHELITEALREKYPRTTAVIHFENSFVARV